MGSNGHRGPFAPLRPRASSMALAPNVPILGQPAKILGWSATFVVECACGTHLTLTGKIGMAVGCQQCRRVVIVNGLRSNGPRLEVDFKFGMMPSDSTPEPQDAPLG